MPPDLSLAVTLRQAPAQRSPSNALRQGYYTFQQVLQTQIARLLNVFLSPYLTGNLPVKLQIYNKICQKPHFH